MTLEKRIKRLEGHTDETGCGYLITYPGGELHHGEGPVKYAISCHDKQTAELTLRLLNGELPGSKPGGLGA